MLRSMITNNTIRFVCGFLLGAMLVFTLAFGNKEEVSAKPIEDGVFGDISISYVDVNLPEHPDIKEMLIIRKGDYPFIYMYKDSSNKIVRWAIVNGSEGVLALSEFNEKGISEFAIYGNKIHDNQRMPVFTFDASDKPGVWYKVMYMPTVKTIVENGILINYAPNGEKYEDIDFDGQFDVKSFVVESFKYLSQSIYIDGKWKELGWTDSQGEFHQTGSYIVDRFYAFNNEGDKKVEFDFEFGKGWKKRSDATIDKSGKGVK